MNAIHGLRAVALVAALTVLPSGLGLAAGDPAAADRLFKGAVADFEALRASPARQRLRESYTKVLEKYRRVFEGYPKTRQAEISLLHAGQLHTLLFKWTKQESDLNRAQHYYQRLIEGYPKSTLRDDAQLALGYLYLDQYGDKGQAYLKFREVARLAPKGDRTAEATSMAKKLARFAPHEPPPATAAGFEPACPAPPALPASPVAVPSPTPAPPIPPPAPPTVAMDPAPAQPPASTPVPARVTNIRHWSNPEYTRVVVDLDQPTNFYANLLEDASGAGTPPRLYLDLFSSRVDSRFCQPIPVNDGILLKIRTGQYSAESVRVVLDIDRLRNYRIFPMENPFRVVIDVTGGDDAATVPQPASRPAPAPRPTGTLSVPALPLVQPEPFPSLAPLPVPPPPEAPIASGGAAAAPPSPPPPLAPPVAPPRPAPKPEPVATGKPSATPPAPVPSGKLSLAQQLGLGVRRVVIDAGHGAHDPGAIGVGGIQEKDVTLDLALRVRDLLRKAGVETILTRDRDIYLPLEERTAIANTARGDLFLSLHCNASDQGNLSGIETYFLNLASSRRAMATAARENSMSVARMSDLEHILKAIFSSKMDESSRLAEMVQKSLHGSVRKRYRDVKDLGVKQAPFYVLIGAEMPSILAEVSFINHRVEGKRLASEDYRHVLAAALADGVVRYIKSVKFAVLDTGMKTP